jgi:hypothetical protein
MKKKDIQQFEKFALALYACALSLFILALIFHLIILTIVGWVFFFGAIYIKYIYLPSQTKKKKKKVIVLEEVHASEIAKPKVSLSEYWDKFIYWLNN